LSKDSPRLRDAMKRYLHNFDTQTEPYRIIEEEMQNTMMEFGFVDLWEGNIEKYNIEAIKVDDPDSYQPAIDNADLVMLKVLISYKHRRITHWDYASLYSYSDFFVYALKKLIALLQ
jgi:hypothetical protein